MFETIFQTLVLPSINLFKRNQKRKRINMPRRTKIVATLGPATDDREVLKNVLAAGVNVVRLNFSHGIPQDHIDRAKMLEK